MSVTNFFKKNWIHFAAIGIFLIVVMVYFNLQLRGYALKQHDIQEYVGMTHEASDYREADGEEILWTSSMFGGMPTVQTSLIHDGNWFGRITAKFLLLFPSPMGIVLLYMLGFYFMARMMKVNHWISIVGALCYAFLSYNIILLQAGHNSKGLAVAFMAPVIGAFIMAYRRNWVAGTVFSALFMSFEMASNHLQVTYYMGSVILALGFVELFRAIKSKAFKKFGLATAGVIAAYGLALLVNYGNIFMTSSYAKHTIRGGNDVTITTNGASNASVQTKDGLDREYVTQYSYGIDESFTLISPYVKGGATVPFGESQFVDKVENSDLTGDEMERILNGKYVYWGDQPGTSGPVYLGVIMLLLAILGLVYLREPSTYALFAVAVFTLMLSWGKNYMGLTNWFLDNVPGYTKFRAVTIILVIADLCIPVIAILFLDKLAKNRDVIKQRIKPFYIVAGVFFVFLVGVRFAGIDENYLSGMERDPMIAQKMESNIVNQIQSMTPEQLQANGIDPNNPAQIQQIVDGQMEMMNEENSKVQEIRKSIFESSMNRSILFAFLAIVVLLILFRTSVSAIAATVGVGVLAFIDLIGVSYNYLNNKELENTDGYKYWVAGLQNKYPFMPEKGDLDILEAEKKNPRVAAAIREGVSKGKQKAIELEAVGSERKRIEYAYAFAALNRNTNYRVFDLSSGFSSARASYFHKALGGYHGAKLRNIQNLIEFHLATSNNKVYDMMNVRYILKPTNEGLTMEENKTSLGNAWFVKRLKVVKGPNEEIRSLGSRFKLVNVGSGKLFVNGMTEKQAGVYGGETIQYLLPGLKDTLTVPLSNGITKGIEVVFVRDVNGKSDLIMKEGIDRDTTNSFTQMVAISVDQTFEPAEEAVMIAEEASKVSGRKWSGEGSVQLTSYAPHKLTYNVKAKGKQLAVFSEIYYPNGWSATIDGKPVEIRKVNYLLRGLEIPDGSHKVVFSYTSEEYESANTLSLFASVLVLLIFGGYIFWIIRNPKKEEEALSEETN